VVGDVDGDDHFHATDGLVPSVRSSDPVRRKEPDRNLRNGVVRHSA